MLTPAPLQAKLKGLGAYWTLTGVICLLEVWGMLELGLSFRLG